MYRTVRLPTVSGPPPAPHVLSDAYIDRALSWALEDGRIVFTSELVGRDFSYLWAVPHGLGGDRISGVDDPGESAGGGGPMLNEGTNSCCEVRIVNK